MQAARRFGEMSEEQFADYLYNNPGGASKAFLLRCEGLPKVKAEVRTEWKTKVEYKERVVEVPVEKIVRVEQKVRRVPMWMKVVTGVSLVIGGIGMYLTPEMMVVEKAVPGPVREVVREVPGPERVVEVLGPERVVEVPVEVVREVNVVSNYLENKLRARNAELESYIGELHGQLAAQGDALSRVRYR